MLVDRSPQALPAGATTGAVPRQRSSELGRRRQFLKRMVQFADWSGLELRLVYYPPYHSKYNKIERCWSSLQHKWNGVFAHLLGSGAGLRDEDDMETETPAGASNRNRYAKG